MSFVSETQAVLQTWTGGGTNANWGTATNWDVSGVIPANGDDLVFAGSTRLVNSNSIIGLAVNSIAYNNSGFSHNGQALMITNGIVDTAGNNTNAIALVLGGSQSFLNQAGGTTHQISGTINMSNFSLTIGGGGDVFLNGVISGNGAVGVNSLNVNDSLVRLGGANTFNGGVNINSGTVRLGNAGGIPSGNGRGNLNIASGATLDLGNQSPTVNGLNGAGLVDEITTNTGNYTFTLGTGANSNGVFSGTIQNTFGTISLVKNGSGTQELSGGNSFLGSVTVNGGVLRLSGPNSYVGATTINGGSLALAAGASIVSTNFIIASGGVFDVSGAGGFTLNGDLRGGRTSNPTNDIIGDLTLNSGNLTPVIGLPGTLTIAGNLTLNGGILNLDLNNVTTVGGGVNDLITLTNGGSLTLGGLTLVKIKPFAGSLAGGVYTLINGSTLPINGGPGNLQLAVPRGISATFDTTTQPTNLLVTASGSANPATIVWAGNGSGGPWDVVVSQNWLSNGVPDYFYDLDTAIFNNAAGAANATVNLPGAVSPSSITVDNSAFNYNLGVANSDPGFITGTGGLTKNGSGNLTLNTPNNFTGPVTINGGSIVSGFPVSGQFFNQIVLYNGVTPGTVTLGNGGLYLSGLNNTPTAISLGLVSINPGGSSLTSRSARQSNVSPFWDVWSISRNGVGGTLDFNSIITRTGSHCGMYITNATALTVNGILGGWATWNLNDWVVPLNTGNGTFNYGVYQVNATPSLWGTVSNINVTASPSSAIAASQVVNSLRMFAAATVTINAGQSLTLASGGLLVPNTATGAGTITGGTLLGATNADLIILQNNSANNLTIGSVIADNTNNAATSGSALTKAGQGTAILTANNTYSGVTYINGATLTGNNNGNNLPTTAAAGTLQIGNNGTSGGISNSPSVANNGTLAFSRSDTVGYSGVVSGIGGVKQQGTGTSVLTADNTYSGVTTIMAGTLQIGNGGASGSFNNSVSVANAASLVFNRTGTIGYPGQISGIGSLTVQGGATLILNTNETYSGSTVVSNGKLVLGAAGSISNSPLITLASGTVLDATTAGGIALSGTGGGQVLAGNGGVSGNVTSGNNTRLSPGGDGAIGTLTLSNALTLNGGTVSIDVNGGSRDLLDVKGNLDLTSGTIALNNLGGAIPSGTYKLIGYSGTFSGGIAELSLSGFSQPGQLASLSSDTANEISLVVITGFGADLTWLGDGGANLWNLASALNFTNSAGVVTNFHNNDAVNFTDAGAANPAVNLAGSLTAASVLVNSTADYTFQGAGRISGGSTLIKAGPNNLTLLTTNNYTGPTIINSGTVTLGNGTDDGALGIGSVTNNAALVFNNVSDQTVGGAVSGSGSIAFNGAGKVTLAGDNSGFSGSATINAGLVQIGSGGSAGTLGTGPVTDNTALIINRSGTLAVGSSIGGSGALTNVGVGTVTLSGTNTYAGPTVIASGTIKAGSTGAIPSGAGVGNVILDAGATAAGILDLNGFNINLNGLDGNNGTVRGQVMNNSGSATNTLTLGNADANGNFSGIIRDNSGSGGKVTLVKTGTGTQTLNISQALGNLYTGGTIISNGVLNITTPGGNSPLIPGANGVAFGSGPITFYGGTLSLAGSVPIGTSPTFGASVNTFVVPAGQTGTVNPIQRGAVNSALVGSGTFFYNPAYVRGEMGGDWSGFTGLIVLTGQANGGQMGLNTAIGFPNARVTMTNGVSLYARNTITGTPTIPIGELFGGNNADAIVSTAVGVGTGANAIAANWAIGGLNTSSAFGGRIIDTVGLIKTGTGTLTLNGLTSTPYAYGNGDQTYTTNIVEAPPGTFTTNLVDNGDQTYSTNRLYGSSSLLTYSGTTTISNGVLALVVPNTLDASTTITLAAPGAVLDARSMGYVSNILDESSIITNSLLVTNSLFTLNTLNNAQTLRGVGTLNGILVSASGSTVSPGLPTGTLTVTTNVTLGGAVVISINEAASPNSGKLTSPLITVVSGSTLVVTNIGSTNLSAGVTYQLFNQAVSGFDSVTLPPLPCANLSWTDNLAVNGSITVVGTPCVNTTSTDIVSTFDGSNLTLSWPADHTGWRLQVQTNSLSTGIGSNWFDVPDSTATNQVVIPVNPANGTVFFRLVYP